MADFKQTNDDESGNCFSEANFVSVYNYLDTQIKKSSLTFYKYKEYDLYLSNTAEISFKKEGYTLSKIFKDKGVVSLAKRKQDNDKSLKEMNHLFCELVLSAINRRTLECI